MGQTKSANGAARSNHPCQPGAVPRMTGLFPRAWRCARIFMNTSVGEPIARRARITLGSTGPRLPQGRTGDQRGRYPAPSVAAYSVLGGARLISKQSPRRTGPGRDRERLRFALRDGRGDDAYASVCASSRTRRPSTVIHTAPADRSDEARLHRGRIQRRADSLTQPSSGKNEPPERNVSDSAEAPADRTGQV